MAKKTWTVTGPVDCACVIHSSGYDWQYVDRLYNSLSRNIPQGIRFHVYTESHRSVPDHMIRHNLDEWPGVAGPRRSWWYKLQLFNSQHHRGPLLYFDLDTVIVRDLSWMVAQDPSYFWAVRDFKYLQRPVNYMVNSSIMWFDTAEYSWVWDRFAASDISATTRQYPGDQDYIHATIDHTRRRFFDHKKIQSWRWQCSDGGYDFARRCHRTPGTGTHIDGDVSVLVFHGRPKPHEITDPIVADLWR